MNRIIHTLLIMSALLNLNFSVGPDIEFDNVKYNYGRAKVGSLINHTFYITNSGDQPLVLLKVVPSCGCSVASYTKEAIKPGGKGEIVVKFNSKYKPVGLNVKTFTVFSNAKNTPHTIYLRGELI
ncbi:MAG: DUF1573 domain-containing protein [Bacteroidetes bacterium]|nr:DUF1573 domain-containing protein [Bacteroidota bacterium]